MSNPPSESQISSAYVLAQERYAAQGVNTERALSELARIALSLHCWQGDDVVGLENTGEALSGGIATTGNYPGKARTADELRADLDLAFRLIPGRHRLNLHAMYAETGEGRAAMVVQERVVRSPNQRLTEEPLGLGVVAALISGLARFVEISRSRPQQGGKEHGDGGAPHPVHRADPPASAAPVGAPATGPRSPAPRWSARAGPPSRSRMTAGWPKVFMMSP